MHLGSCGLKIGGEGEIMRGSMCVCVCEAVVGRFGVTTWCWVVCLGFGWYNGGL